jgi:hypothetical protein
MQQLRGIAAFLPILEDPAFNAGFMTPGKLDHSGALIPPYPSYSKVALDFSQSASAEVVKGFDWAKWSRTAEAQTLANDPAALAQATTEQLRHLLTVILRRDHFCPGALLEDFESGLILGIVRRAAAISRDE